MDSFAKGHIRSYVIRAGRMSAAQKRSYELLFPSYAIKSNECGIFSTSENFLNENPLVIEIGFGMGRATAVIAEQNPRINYLGIEVHKPGIGRLLWEIEKRNLNNIRIAEGDASDFIKDKILDHTVSGFHIFFPDPWPKKRHYKRRLVTRPFTDMLASKLIFGGYIYMVSDWFDYAEWALGELGNTKGLKNKYSDFSPPQSWRPKTEFEQKGLKKNHVIKELFFLHNEE